MSKENKYPHVPAAFINVIADEGTKFECLDQLQMLWNENCALRDLVKELEESIASYSHGAT